MINVAVATFEIKQIIKIKNGIFLYLSQEKILIFEYFEKGRIRLIRSDVLTIRTSLGKASEI